MPKPTPNLSQEPGNIPKMPQNKQEDSQEYEIRNNAAFEPQKIMEWVTPAYAQTEKSMGWYIMMGLIVLIFVVYGLFFSDENGWIVSVTFLILAGVYYLSELRPSPLVQVGISELGIRFGSRFYSYDQIKAFWIINSAEMRKLHLITYKGVSREIDIFIPEDINIALLRDYLRLHIHEEEGRKERFSDQLIRNLGL